MEACQYGLVEQVHYFIKTGVNVNMADFVSFVSTCEEHIMYVNSCCMHVYCQNVANRWRIQSAMSKSLSKFKLKYSTRLPLLVSLTLESNKVMCEHQTWLTLFMMLFQSQHCWAAEQAWFRHIAWFTSLDSLWSTFTWLTKTFLSIRPGKLDFLLCIRYLICMQLISHYSLFLTSKCYTHSAYLKVGKSLFRRR